MSKKTNLIVGAAATVAATSLLVGCNLYGKETYKITFETNGGNALEPVELEWGVEYKASVVPTKTGHTFKGWYFDAGLTNPVTEDIIIEGDISLFAKWEINQYTVKFDSNGGTEIAEVKQNYGTAINVSEPTKAGYEFEGWFTDKKCEKEFNLKVPGKDTTVYAKWKECKVEITFDINGTNVTGEMSKVSFETEDENLNLPKSNYARDGYSFKGWSTRVDGQVEFADQGSISSLLNKSQKVTLYAVWEAREYDLHFISNGLAYGEDIKVKYDSNMVFPQTNPTKDGHEFLGWGTYSVTTDTIFANNKVYYTYNETSKVYSVVDATPGASTAGTTYYEAKLFSTTDKMPNSNVTLNAVWSKDSYTISFNSNGAGTIESITQPFGSAVTLPTSLTKTGYTFVGWYQDEALTSRFESETMPLNGASLYAKWSANSYSIFFASNQGSGNMEKLTVSYDQTVSLTANSFSRTGYTFTGWNTEADGSGTSYTNTQEIRNLLSEDGSSLTLYAQWEANTDTKYVVKISTRKLDGTLETVQSYQDEGTSDTYVDIELLDYEGFVTPENIQIYIKADGTAELEVIYERKVYEVKFTAVNPETNETITEEVVEVKYEGTIPTFPSSFEVKNYSLVWKCGGEVVNETTMITSNMTLVAEYTRIEKTIVIHSEGQQNQNIQNIDAGTKVLSYLEAPSKTGYTFLGWYLDSTFETELSEDYLMPEDNLDIYVKWEIKQYSISFGEDAETITQDYNSTVTLPTPSKTGYTFEGWLKDGQSYSVTSMPAEDIELTAKWTPITYSIIYDGNGASKGNTNSTTNVKYDTYVDLATNGYEKDGYHFIGWSTSTSVSDILNINEVIKNLASTNGETVTLYAIWGINEYTYKFHIVDEDGNILETLSSNTFNYNAEILVPSTNKQDKYPTSYSFNGWYSDSSCTGEKASVHDRAGIDSLGNSLPEPEEEEAINYYGKYSTESYKVQFRDGNDGIIWETTVPEDDEELNKEKVQTQFYGYVNGLYRKVQAYDFIYSALEEAGNMINPNYDKISLLSVYLVLCLEIKVEDVNNPLSALPVIPGFKDYSVETQVYILTENNKNLDATSATYICSLLSGIFDYSNPNDLAYLSSILAASDATTIEIALNATSMRREDNAKKYDKYKNNAFCPTREGYKFNGWKIYIDKENNIKVVDATWVKKLDTPIYLRVQSIGKKSVEYAWNAVENAQKYTVIYTIKDDQGNVVVLDDGTRLENVEDTTSNLSYKVENLSGGYTVSLSVKASYVDDQGQIVEKSNEITLPDGVALDPTVVKTIPSIDLSSEETEKVTYEHLEVGNVNITGNGPYYYQDSSKSTFYLFENSVYHFTGMQDMIIEGDTDAVATQVYDDKGNVVEVKLETSKILGSFKFTAVRSNGTEVTYTAHVQPLINGLSLGTNLTTYTDALAGKSNFKVSAVEGDYLIGAAAINDASSSHNGYSYEVELEDNTVKTYYNGFKFDINALSTSGNTYQSHDFDIAELQLSYKFYVKNDAGNFVEITNPSELYVRDEENDVIYFLKDVGTYKVEISYKTDGYYVTEDTTVDEDKTYYYTEDGGQSYEKAENLTSLSGNTYYEYYQAIGIPQAIKADPSSLNKFKQELVFTLNSSINVFDHASLRDAYADPKVSSISMHANIEAKFDADQVVYNEYMKDLMNYDNPTDSDYGLDDWWSTFDGNVDAKPGTAVFSDESGLKNRVWVRTKTPTANSIYGKDGYYYDYSGQIDKGDYALVDAEWVNNWNGGKFAINNNDVSDRRYNAMNLPVRVASIYQRTKDSSPTGGVVVNGNFFEIDGSKLPYVKSDINASQNNSYHIQNTRVSIFDCGHGETAFNNLAIYGNTKNVSSSNMSGSSLSVEEYMTITSGGVKGISFSSTLEANEKFCKDIYMRIDNVIIEDTYIGLGNGSATSSEISNTIINNSWSNAYYSYGGRVTKITNSDFLNSGGSSLHITDIEAACKNDVYEQWLGEGDEGYGTKTENPQLIIDSKSHIDNFVSGEEPWFKQQGMEIYALNIKAGLETLAKQVSLGLNENINAGLSAKGMPLVNINRTINKVVNVNGLETEKMNLMAIGMIGHRAADHGHPDVDREFDLVADLAIINTGKVPGPFGGGMVDKYTVYADVTNKEDPFGNPYELETCKMYVVYETNLPTGPVKVLVELVNANAQ